MLEISRAEILLFGITLVGWVITILKVSAIAGKYKQIVDSLPCVRDGEAYQNNRTKYQNMITSLVVAVDSMKGWFSVLQDKTQQVDRHAVEIDNVKERVVRLENIENGRLK